MDRRGVIKGVAAIGLYPALAGCSTGGGLSAPSPTVLDANAEAGWADAFANQAKVHVTVKNEGSAGDVNVYVEVYDNRDTVLGRYGDEYYMKEDERRRVTVRVEVPDDAEYYEAHAEV